MPLLYLASGSPRRQALLQQLGIPFACLLNDVEEIRQPAEPARHYAMRLAREKALSGVARAPADLPVLAADTVVSLHDDIFGKPADTDHACTMLRQLSAQTHQVITALAIANRQRLMQCCVMTEVTFCPLSEQAIRHYVASGEPMDKAGAYAIQGLAARFIRRINGSYHGVVGLPLAETEELFNAFCQTDATPALSAGGGYEH